MKELVLLPALALWLAKGGKQPLWARWLGAQVLAALTVEAIGLYTRHNGISNHGIYNAYMIIEFATLWGMVGSVPLVSKILTRLAGIGFAVTTSVWIIDLSIKGTVLSLSTNTLIIGGTLLAVTACMAIYWYMRITFNPLHQEPLFWGLLSVIAYFMCFIPTFGVYNYLSTHSPELAFRILFLNDILFLLRYLLVCISLALLIRPFKAEHAGR